MRSIRSRLSRTAKSPLSRTAGGPVCDVACRAACRRDEAIELLNRYGPRAL